MRPRSILGVDFSGAAQAGRNAWLARCDVRSKQNQPLALLELKPLEALAGDAARDVVMRWLVDTITESPAGSLWAIDFPFGLPIELGHASWAKQLAAVQAWDAGAHAFGLECCRLANERHGRLHIRRDTDRETRTPFDCYHYRIVYQMFHGMRDVLLPLRKDRSIAILPFDAKRMDAATRIVAEACPGSTLRRLALPHNRYKQSTPGRVAVKYRRVRETILAGIERFIAIDDRQRRTILSNPGGDALDAVLAAVGAWDGWQVTDWQAIARHPRYAREGFVLC